LAEAIPAADCGGTPPYSLESEPIRGTSCLADRLEVDVEYLLWWLREGRVPPLLTTSSAASAGVLGRPDTRVLYGDTRLETRHGDRFNGTRVGLGYWLDEGRTFGVEGSAFFLERDSTYFKAVSDGSQVLARPYVNALDGSQTSEIIASSGPPAPRNGGFVGYSRVELFGEEMNVKAVVLAGDAGRVELLAGAHFLQMRDRVDLTATGHPLADPSTLLGLTDHFRVEDRFWGGQVGLRGELTRGPWHVTLTGEVSPGVTDATLRAFGDRTFQTPAVKVVTPYGLAVGPSNAGRFSHTEFDVVTQVVVNAGYQLTRRVCVFTGYTFLYWANPLRAGDQIDLVVNPSLTTSSPHGPSRPALPFRTDAFWAQGWNVGLQFTW
jgi:hypothetical protein